MNQGYQNGVINGMIWPRCQPLNQLGTNAILQNHISLNPIVFSHIPIRLSFHSTLQNVRASSNLCHMAYREFNFGNYQTAEAMCNRSLNENGVSYDCYIILAMISFRLHNFDKLEKYVDLALSLNPSMAEPYVLKGVCAKEKGKFVEAIGLFRYSLHIRPDNIDSLVGLSNCYSALNDHNSALNYLAIALQKNPDSLVLRNELANVLRASGRLEEAKKCYEVIVERKPDFALAWLSLGHIHWSLGSPWLALHSYEKALLSDQYLLDAYIFYGNVLKDLKLSERSIHVYHKAISFFPNVASLYAGLASACHDFGLHDYAIENFNHAISLQPNYPDVYCNLANILKEKGFVSEAEKNYYHAINLCPTHADSYNNLANILRERGKINDCVSMYRKALEISPNFAAAHSNLATVLQQCGRLNEAIAHFQRAVDLNPNYCEAHCFLGNALKEFGDYKSSIECFIRAININQFSPDAHAFLGTAYKDIGQFDLAIPELLTSLKYRPDFNDVFCSLVHCYILVCDWTDYDQNCQKVASLVIDQIEKKRQPTVHPHHTMLFPIPPLVRKEIASRHAIICTERVSALGYQPTSWSVDKLPSDEIIKIGYVSSDFGNHPTSHLIQSIPGKHNHDIFKVYCYSLNPSDQSSFRIKIEKEANCFFDVSQMVDPLEVANLIKSHGIHILLNLNGYTKGARNEIFALKPAPIQVMYLGYPSTSGSDYMDYIITDKVVSPIKYADHYSEKFAYMPNSFFIGDHAYLFPHVLKDLTHEKALTSKITNMYKSTVNHNLNNKTKDVVEIDGIVDESTLNSYVEYHIELRNCFSRDAKNYGEAIPSSDQQIMSRSMLSVNNDAFIYCNFNQLYKFDPETFSCWCRILKRVPNSYLWILRFPKQGEDRLKDFVKKFDLNPSRLIFTEVASKEEHVRRGQIADVCLDTPICNGHTTGMDVLWAGCPIVTLPRETFASRVGASIINAIGLGKELIANTLEEYEEIAVKLGSDKKYYQQIKTTVWYNRTSSSLFNIPIYTKDFDNLLYKIWQNYKKSGKIEHILDQGSMTFDKS